MKIVIAAWLALMPQIAAADTADRKSVSVIFLDDAGSERLEGCTVSGNPGAAMLSGQLLVHAQPGQPAIGIGFDVDLAPSSGSAPPTVSAHAINTKGTGGSNKARLAAPSCAVSPATAAGGAAPVATCTVTDSPEGMAVSFSVPLSVFGPLAAAKTGHVTLLKRGNDSGGATIVAQCSSTKPTRGGWDLATLKGA